MSTHRAEIEWLAKVAKTKGAVVGLGLDDRGYVQTLSIRGLPGSEDISGPVLAMVEQLRRDIGPGAREPRAIEKIDGHPQIQCYRYHPDQMMAYAGDESLLRGQAYQGRLEERASIATVHLDPKTGEDRYRFWHHQDREITELASIEECIAMHGHEEDYPSP